MSEIKKVDCRGLACPQPVINTKKALDSITGGVVVTLVDNDTSRENVTLFARNLGYATEVEKTEGNYRITITKGSPGEIKDIPDSPPAEDEQHPTVYLITSNLLGQGSPDLGQVLMKSLMVTLSEADPPPRALLFLNTGVMLTCQGSPVLDLLQKLSDKGTVLVSCGTCLDYYKIKDKLAAGRVGNMLDIHGYVTGSPRVVTIA